MQATLLPLYTFSLAGLLLYLFTIIARHCYTAFLLCISYLLLLTSSAISSTISMCLAAVTASTPGGIHKFVFGATLIEECFPDIHVVILLAPIISCLRSNQLVYATHTLY